MKIFVSVRSFVVTLVGLLATAQTALARDPVIVNITVDGRSYTRGYSDATEALDKLRNGNIRTLVPGYRPNSDVSAVIDARGLQIRASAVPNSSAIRLSSADANYDRVFDAGTREATRDQVNAFLRGDEDQAGLRQLVRAVVATSTADPVAGNPSSLLGQSVIADFAAGAHLPGDDGGLAPRAAGWHAGLGASLQRQSAGEFDVNSYSLPIAVSYSFGQDGPEVFLQAPLILTDTNGGTAYMGSAALGVRLPLVTRPDLRWALSPMLRWGAAGSEEVGAVGQVFGGALVSDLRIGLGSFTLGFGNGISRYQTEPLKVGRYHLSYALENWAFRNGASLSVPVAELGGRRLEAGISFTDTRMAGDTLAVASWQEYGVFATLGGGLRASASYLHGERGFNGFRLGVAAGF